MVLLKELFDEAIKNQPFSKDKMSQPKRKRLQKSKYKTGFKNISRVYCQSCKQKFTYQYEYYDENDKRRYVTSVDFLKLRDKVRNKKLNWEIDSEYYAKKTAKEVGLPLRDLR